MKQTMVFKTERLLQKVTKITQKNQSKAGPTISK